MNIFICVQISKFTYEFVYIYIYIVFFSGVFFGDLLPLGFNSMRQKKTSARCWLKVLPLLPSMPWGTCSELIGLTATQWKKNQQQTNS